MKPLILLAIGIACGGCAKSGRTPIVVYSPHGKEMLASFADAYEEIHPEAAVEWLDMGSQDVYDRVRTEKENPQADIWWGGPMTSFSRAEREGLLERYVPAWDSVSVPAYRSPGKFWYGTFLTPEVIMYNSNRITQAQAPKDWDDLLDPASGTMRIIFSSIIMRELQRGGTPGSAFGWLRKLDANTKTYAADPTQLYIAIAREEGLVTLWDLPDVMLQVEAHHYPFAYVLPASGTPLITDGIALVRGTKHPDEAKQFYEFVTSRASMTRQAREFFRIPARSDIPRSDLPPWMQALEIRPLPVDFDTLAAREKDWMKTWDEKVRGRGSEPWPG
jgi:iron(III) transport system substrate-binding protein